MNNSLKIIIVCIIALVAFATCDDHRPVRQLDNTDTAISGTAAFLVDESFKPIMDQEHYVFKSLYTDTKPVLIYKSENELLRMLLNDSVRTAIMSRELKPDELMVLKNRTLSPEVTRFASDAVAIIVNAQSVDTLMTVNEVKALLKGTAMTEKNVVFDNPNSSLVRYLKDLSGNQELKQKNVYALNTNKDVVTYVSKHPNAVGIVGYSWLNEPDADYAVAATKVKIVGVRDESNKEYAKQYFKPSQETLALKQYPLSRSLYVINSTGRPNGLASAFADFLKSERGQRIILKSGLLPAAIPPREINIVKN
ncbi:PstS family phosphate ABC transporter substrate-binding protein [Mucilaginibacter terrae]|uniref:PstS family phosphate ABC transporter substrate-binding protein n=1 Tax=Mucilaginibacter terrae TaxID=1955052 RepID=UPI00363D8F86